MKWKVSSSFLSWMNFSLLDLLMCSCWERITDYWLFHSCLFVFSSLNSSSIDPLTVDTLFWIIKTSWKASMLFFSLELNSAADDLSQSSLASSRCNLRIVSDQWSLPSYNHRFLMGCDESSSCIDSVFVTWSWTPARRVGRSSSAVLIAVSRSLTDSWIRAEPGKCHV